MKLLALILILILINSPASLIVPEVFSDEAINNPKELYVDDENIQLPTRAQVVDVLDQLNSLSAEEEKDKFIPKWRNYLLLAGRYFHGRRKVCLGEVSEYIFQRDVDSLTKITKINLPVSLTQPEQKYCWLDLKNLEIRFIESSYNAQKNYLIFLQNRRLVELENTKRELVDYLNRGGEKNFKNVLLDNTFKGK